MKKPGAAGKNRWRLVAAMFQAATAGWCLALAVMAIASIGLLTAAALQHPASASARISADLRTLSLRVDAKDRADAATLCVRPVAGADDATAAGDAPAMLGSWREDGDGSHFTPIVPFLGGQTYRVAWRTPDGRVASADCVAPTVPTAVPSVKLLAAGAVFPANALKLYLQFSEPMEQGVFLDRLRLLDRSGAEVVGPFRETELWSPDGERLTVWLHPGRQKVGVNLNEDEGPVLRAGEAATLVVAGVWRSADGVPLGADQRFTFKVGAADHESPRLERWNLTLPRPGTRDSLAIIHEEPLDPAMLSAALTIVRARADAGANTAVPGAIEIDAAASVSHFVPESPWQPGRYELHVHPDLEDLAGNNLLKPFEIDVTQPSAPARPPPLSLAFEIGPR